MKVCEVCGTREELEQNVEDTTESVILHVCESCQEDRTWHTFES